MSPSDPVARVSARGSVGVTQTQFADLPAIELESGQVLGPLRIAYETYGRRSDASDNIVLVCHALSGDAHAAGLAPGDVPTAVDGIGAEERGIRSRGGLGWWDNLIGPGKAFDTDLYHVVSTNIIGSCRGSTGPASTDPATGRPYADAFPVVTVVDMVHAQRELMRLMEISHLLAVAGGSLGGMQALEWTLAYPEMVRGCILTASTAALGTQGIALNAVARHAIMSDPDWQGGRYYGTGRQPDAGIGVARMIGHITYLSAVSMQEKFDRRLQDRNEYSYALDVPDFAVESYLRHQARTFADRFDANSYLYISRALTYYDAARSHGNGSLACAVRNVRANYLLLSFTSDWIYPTADAVRLESALLSQDKSVERHEIETTYGHDSFLLEDVEQTAYIRRFLQDLAERD